MLTFIASLVAYLAYVFTVPLIITAVNDLDGATVPDGLKALVSTVNGILWAGVALFAALMSLRGYGAFINIRESRKGEDET